MKVKYTMDRSESDYKKKDAIEKVMRDLGNKVTITGDEIQVDDGYDERKVVDILNRVNVKYSRST